MLPAMFILQFSIPLHQCIHCLLPSRLTLRCGHLPWGSCMSECLAPSPIPAYCQCASCNTVDVGLKTSLLATHVGDLDGILAPGFNLAWPWLWQAFREVNQHMAMLSLSLSLSLSKKKKSSNNSGLRSTLPCSLPRWSSCGDW